MKAYYNGVCLYRVLTKRWSETVVYDSSGINMLGNQINLVLEATILNDDATSTTPATPPDELATNFQSIDIGINSNPQQRSTAETKLNRALRLLSIPRQAFVMYDDATGSKIFEAYPDSILGDGQTRLSSQSDDGVQYDARQKMCVDVNSGPKPRNVTVVSAVAGCYRINFEIEVVKIRCLGGETGEIISTEAAVNVASGYVISNRCWTAEEVDENFYTTRTFSGILRMSRNDVSSHCFRNAFYPPLESGFKRVSVRFSESQDGLSLEYVVTDKQVRNAAPYPVTKFEGSIQYNNTNGVVEDVTTQLTVTGSVFAPRRLLLAVACKTMENRIRLLGRCQYGYLVKATVAENLGDPPSFTITTRHMIHCNVKSSSATEQYSNGYSDEPVSGKKNLSVEINRNQKTGATNKIINSETKRGVINGKAISQVTNKAETTTGAQAPINQSASDLIADLARITPQNMGFIGEEIGNHFPESVSSNGMTWTYDRKLSQKPSPYGYDVYCVYEDETKTSSEKTEGAFQFIKAIASVPCAPQLARVQSGAELKPSEVSGAYATKVELTSQTQLVDAESTGETQDDANYPYTYYKSHAIYTADLNRIVKPAFYGTANDDEFGDPVILQVAPPTGKLFVTIEAERLNALPELPDVEEIITFYRQSEIEGGATGSEAERPTPEDQEGPTTQMTTSNAHIDNYCYDARTNKRISAIGRRNSVQIAEPVQGVYGQGTTYKVLANYEYVLTRPLRKGDEVRLLLNPLVTQASCYYPTNGLGEKEPWKNRRLFSGNQLNHFSEITTDNNTESE